MTGKQYDPWFHVSTPVNQDKEITHLKHLLLLCVPIIEREELSTKTSEYNRSLIAAIREVVQ